jgi:hypothetical protein
LIHESFARVTDRLAAEGSIVERAVVEESLTIDIAATLPELAPDEVKDHAAKLSIAMQQSIATGFEQIAHEKYVSIPLAPGVKLTGRIDTIIEDVDGLVIVERKSGEKRSWHILQIQAYAEMTSLIDPGTRIKRLELWYSRHGVQDVPVSSGEVLTSLKRSAERGVAMEALEACDVYSNWCAECPRHDCGAKSLKLARAKPREPTREQ